jgi:hypothetical protein
MLDFTPVRARQQAMQEFAQALTLDALRLLTEESVEAQLALLDGLTDTDITFVPDDPDASDPYAADPGDRRLAWTIGHVVAHATASAEEYAAVAATLARGIDFHGRPRAEAPWREMTTVARCRQRLLESRRMRLASLEMWPNVPDLERGYAPWRASGWVNATGIFTWGLAHDDDHIRQLEKIAGQARSARLAGEVRAA